MLWSPFEVCFFFSSFDHSNRTFFLITLGSNFTEGMQITIEEPVTDIEFISSEEIQCRIAPSSAFSNPKNLKTSKVSVIMVDNIGRSTVGVDAFEVDIDLADILAGFGDWLADNPIYTTLIVLAVVALFAGGGVYCYRERRKAQGLKDLP